MKNLIRYENKNELFYLLFERVLENELKPFLVETLLPTTQLILMTELYKLPKQPAGTDKYLLAGVMLIRFHICMVISRLKIISVSG